MQVQKFMEGIWVILDFMIDTRGPFKNRLLRGRK